MNDIPELAQIAVPLEDGSWASAKIVRIVELIHDYDPHITVKWIPRDRRAPGDDAFQLFEERNGKEYAFMSVRDESEFDERVLKRIIDADNLLGNVQQKMEAHNEMLRDLERREREEKRAEAREFAAAVFGSPLNRYVHNGVRFDLPQLPTTKQRIIIP